MTNLALIPHNDDESLFLAFTLCREAADIQVVVIFDGYVQAQRGEPVTWQQRREETVAALKELGVVKPPMFAGFSDQTPDWGRIGQFLLALSHEQAFPTVYAPYEEINGHYQHNMVGRAALGYFDHVEPYTTYTTEGKSIGTRPVIPEASWVTRKLRALACYQSQIQVENCREHFMRGLHEYYA